MHHAVLSIELLRHNLWATPANNTPRYPVSGDPRPARTLCMDVVMTFSYIEVLSPLGNLLG